MCSRLKLARGTPGGMHLDRGQQTQIETPHGPLTLPWGIPFPWGKSYFARSENLGISCWKRLAHALLPIEGFEEKGHVFPIEGTVACLYNPLGFVIVTVPSTPEVALVHHRMPCFASTSWLAGA